MDITALMTSRPSTDVCSGRAWLAELTVRGASILVSTTARMSRLGSVVSPAVLFGPHGEPSPNRRKCSAPCEQNIGQYILAYPAWFFMICKALPNQTLYAFDPVVPIVNFSTADTA